jgi:predicted phosphoribosyltransferase
MAHAGGLAMFRNREDAAFRLAARLRERAFHEPLVLAVPRGGMIVGAVLAEELNADLDVLLTRKLRMPGLRELAIGAVAENGVVYLSEQGHALQPRLAAYLDREEQALRLEIARCRQLYRCGAPSLPVRHRSVIVTDDGVATGSTLLAALQVLNGQHPLEVVVAVPVGSAEGLVQIRPWCDEIVCLVQSRELRAISPFYAEFNQVEDDEVVDLLRTFASARPHDPESSKTVVRR